LISSALVNKNKGFSDEQIFYNAIYSVPRGKVSILGGHSTSHFQQKTKIICGFQDKAVILSKKKKMYMMSKIKLFQCTDEKHAITSRVAKCIDVDGGIFENVLH
jgi:hypothetical protein